MSYVTYVFTTYFGYDEEEGREADARGAQRRQVGGQHRHPRGDGARRAGDARVRPVGDDGERARERLSPGTGAAAGSSRRSPASRPTCCARWRRSWSSCCATSAPSRPAATRSRRCSTSPDPPPSPRTRCCTGCSRPPTPTTRRPRRSSAATPRAPCATARPTPRPLIIDTLEEAGLPPQLEEDGLVIDVELDEAAATTWLRSFTDLRLALAIRLGVEEGDEDYWHALRDDDPRAQAHDIYEWVGYLQETLVDALS